MAESDIAIVGASARAGVSQIVLQWAIDDPNIESLPILRFGYAEIWRSSASNMAGAVKLDNAFTAYNDTPVPRGRRYYYRIRAVDRSGQFGPFSNIVSDAEISGDVQIGVPGYWRHPSGLTFQWGVSTCDANGECSATLFAGLGTSFVSPLALSAIVSKDDGAIGLAFANTLMWSVTQKNLTIIGGSSIVVFQVRRLINPDGVFGAGQPGLRMNPAPAGTLVRWFAVGA
jgi:hypothetical protein